MLVGLADQGDQKKAIKREIQREIQREIKREIKRRKSDRRACRCRHRRKKRTPAGAVSACRYKACAAPRASFCAGSICGGRRIRRPGARAGAAEAGKAARDGLIKRAPRPFAALLRRSRARSGGHAAGGCRWIRRSSGCPARSSRTFRAVCAPAARW